VTAVPEGSPAAKAGLKIGDVIVSVEKTRVQKPEELLAALAQHKPGRR